MSLCYTKHPILFNPYTISFADTEPKPFSSNILNASIRLKSSLSDNDILARSRISLFSEFIADPFGYVYYLKS